MPHQVRWLIRSDMPEVLDIERLCFEHAWQEQDFLSCLRQRERNCIGMVVENPQERVIGYMIYEFQKTELHVLNFAVAPDCWRQGVGTAMTDKLLHKLSQHRRTSIRFECRERNLPMQLFLRSQGYRCVGTIRGLYEPDHEDALQFEYRLRDVAQPFAVSNRIAEYLQVRDE